MRWYKSIKSNDVILIMYPKFKIAGIKIENHFPFEIFERFDQSLPFAPQLFMYGY